MNQNNKPLADRLRPESLDEYIGQQHILGEGRLLRRAIEADMLRSIILYGPPACGKTSLAKVISKKTSAIFVQLNATDASKSDVKDVITQAEKMMIGMGKKTILFIDEIHRFNKGQQDTLLPAVEDGRITLIGATTENPYFEVNRALLSRSTIFKLEPLSQEDIKGAIVNALKSEKGLKDYNVLMHDNALEHLAKSANGDLRTAYNALELAVVTTKHENDVVNITLEIAEESIQQRYINYDKGGSNHYDTMSAFIKSMRGGDSTAALHYFARMISAGEDPKALARRIIIHSAEDVGMANPQALQVAVSAFHALEICGIAEARIPLAEAIIYICEASKSNSVYNAINQAFMDVQNKPLEEVPNHLRDSHYKGAKDFGNGEGYIYPHNIPGGWTPVQQYAPNNIHGSDYYKPSNNGFEVNVKKARQQKMERYEQWKDSFK